MDPITHGIAGALIGKGFFSRRHARVAIFAATLGAVFPDVDMIAVYNSKDLFSLMRYHRAFTHSFFGLPLFAALFAWLTRLFIELLAESKSKAELRSPSFFALFLIYSAGIGSHDILDATTYFGTLLWYPISSDRVAWDYLFVVDFTLTALVLLPQAIAWIHNRSRGWLIRGSTAWGVLTILTFGVRALADTYGFAFPLRAVIICSLLFAIPFFSPALNGFGIRFGRARWCQAGFYVACAYIFLCGLAHYAAMARVRSFASNRGLVVEKLGALPLPPSLLDWNGLIETRSGVYQSEFSLIRSSAPAFRFFANSRVNRFTEEAAALKPVETLLWSGRFVVMRFVQRGSENFVVYGQPPYYTGGSQAVLTFSFDVEFDPQGKLIDLGWIPPGSDLRHVSVTPASQGSSP